MPRYMFLVQDGPTAAVELPAIGDAKCEAVRYAGRLMCDAATTFWDAGDFRMTVTDDTGLTLFSLHMIGTEAPALLASSRSGISSAKN